MNINVKAPFEFLIVCNLDMRWSYNFIFGKLLLILGNDGTDNLVLTSEMLCSKVV